MLQRIEVAPNKGFLGEVKESVNSCKKDNKSSFNSYYNGKRYFDKLKKEKSSVVSLDTGDYDSSTY